MPVEDTEDRSKTAQGRVGGIKVGVFLVGPAPNVRLAAPSVGIRGVFRPVSFQLQAQSGVTQPSLALPGRLARRLCCGHYVLCRLWAVFYCGLPEVEVLEVEWSGR